MDALGVGYITANRNSRDCILFRTFMRGASSPRRIEVFGRCRYRLCRHPQHSLFLFTPSYPVVAPYLYATDYSYMPVYLISYDPLVERVVSL